MRNAGEAKSRRSLMVVVSILAALVYTGARADIVTLTNDKVLEGNVTDDGETVTIQMSHGTVKVSKSKVKSIVQKATPQDEYNRRVADLIKNEKAGKLKRAEDAEAWFALSEWAAQNDLTKSRHEDLQRVLELNPDHAAAREALGFVWFDRRWMTQAERYQSMGLVHVDGKWLPPEALQDANRAHEEQRARDQQEEQARADSELKQAQARKLEAETELLQAQTQRERPPVIQPPLILPSAPAQVIILPFPGFYPSPFGFRPPISALPPSMPFPLVPVYPGPPRYPTDPNKPPHRPKPHDGSSNDGKTAGPGVRAQP